MTKQMPLVILGSSRPISDTKSFVDYIFCDTDYKLADLLNYTISLYNYGGTYPSSDNFNKLAEEILAHNTIIFATPVYWYSMSGIMKNLFDRFTDLVTIQKGKGRQLKNKNMFLLAVGSNPIIPDGFETPFKSTADYLDMNYKGYIYFSTGESGTDKAKAEARQTFIDMVKKKHAADAADE